MTFEEWLSGIVKNKSVNLSDMARRTGSSYQAIRKSLNATETRRELRSSELIAICRYVGVNPLDFEGGENGAKKSKEQTGEETERVCSLG